MLSDIVAAVLGELANQPGRLLPVITLIRKRPRPGAIAAAPGGLHDYDDQQVAISTGPLIMFHVVLLS